MKDLQSFVVQEQELETKTPYGGLLIINKIVRNWEIRGCLP